MVRVGGEESDYIDRYTVWRSIDPSRTALVLVDMQNATGSRQGALARRHRNDPRHADALNYRFDRIERLVIPNQNRLIQAIRAAGGHIVVVKMGAQRPDACDAPPHMRRLLRETGNWAGSWEHELVAGLDPGPEAVSVTKTTVGAFASTGLDAVLRGLGIEALLMTGISTNMCVDTTAREAADRGYAVSLVADACASSSAALHEAALANFRRLFGRVTATEAILAELAAASDAAPAGMQSDDTDAAERGGRGT